MRRSSIAGSTAGTRLRMGVAALAAVAAMARAVPASAEATQPVKDAQSTMSAAPGEPALGDDRVRLPPMTIPQDARSRDRRTSYVGAGVVVLAVMFWWNRRRRDRFEREDRGAPARVAARDDDGDDLHAAARSDTPASPDRPDRPDRNARPDRRDP